MGNIFWVLHRPSLSCILSVATREFINCIIEHRGSYYRAHWGSVTHTGVVASSASLRTRNSHRHPHTRRSLRNTPEAGTCALVIRKNRDRITYCYRVFVGLPNPSPTQLRLPTTRRTRIRATHLYDNVFRAFQENCHQHSLCHYQSRTTQHCPAAPASGLKSTSGGMGQSHARQARAAAPPSASSPAGEAQQLQLWLDGTRLTPTAAEAPPERTLAEFLRETAGCTAVKVPSPHAPPRPGLSAAIVVYPLKYPLSGDVPTKIMRRCDREHTLSTSTPMSISKAP